jgi:ABC-type transport system involved in cytochrome c biogenesis permease subunit
MSAPAIPAAETPAQRYEARSSASALDFADGLMKALASLKLTVALFAFAIFVVLVGTLAQTDADIWQVVRDYFHAWIMWVDINLFFPKSFFPKMPHIPVPIFPMPGGMIVGTLMIVNLLAAHGWRFKLQASGTRLWAGLIALAIGIAFTTLIIISGHNAGGFQAQPPIGWHAMWSTLLWLAAAGWVASAVVYVQGQLLPATRAPVMTWLHMLGLVGSAVVLAIVAVTLGIALAKGLYIGDEAMRVLWQLLQGTLSGIALLIGCILLFKKRAGIVLLHAGVLLMMANELIVARYAVEWQVFLQEGQTQNYVRDIRTVELALIDSSDKETNEQIVIPRSLLEANYRENVRLAKQDKPPVFIADPNNMLPVKVAVLQFFKNADVENRQPEDKSPANAGAGLTKVIAERPAARGTDSGGGVDLAAAYVKIADKTSGEELGTFLVSQLASEAIGADRAPEKFGEKVAVGDTNYHLFLRFERDYKPYTIKLLDVRKDDYVASDTPRNYSSDIQLVDKKSGVDKPVHIKMNNPLRYAGETIYQSGYHPPGMTGGKEATTLAVVKNTGWMIPYVACMIVAIGMLSHFLITVTRFVNRRESEELAAGDLVGQAAVPVQDSTGRVIKLKKSARSQPARSSWDYSSICLSILAAGIFVFYVGKAARVEPPASGEMDIAAFGQLPVAHVGRVKPLDTLARNTLRAISHRETLKLEDGKKIPASQWLLEVISGTKQANDFHVIRIDSPEVRQIFELEERKGFLYSINELFPHIQRFEEQVEAARKLKPDELSTEQRRVIELDGALKEYMTVVQAFSRPEGLPKLPSVEEMKADSNLARQYMSEFGAALRRAGERMTIMKAPRVIPTEPESKDATPDAVWKAYPVAWGMAYVQSELLGQAADPAVLALDAIMGAYFKGDAKNFNIEVARYAGHLEKTAPPLWNEKKIHWETYFNHVSPFYIGIPLYAMAFLMAVFGWLFRYKPLNWSAFTLVFLTLVLHTVALGLRIYISGRPPVTNLYSAAVFIGWGCVLFAALIELIYRNGLGNIVAAIAGFATLIVAYFLAAGGDTIAVLQAVLDTQFWLATHVTCITLGYTATYVAGLFGLLYVIFGMATPLLDQALRKDLARMIYGVVCFAIFFSFVGTVLGGLWADDSWGRFWGWDPKENGALIIVLWNALVLHAKWDKMVTDRGLAVLAIGGNIVTSWSFFGVNELGIGLHSYGFTEGVLLALGLFVLSQLIVIIAGCTPTRYWWSYTATPNQQA